MYVPYNQKYRPRTFAEIVGQSLTREILSNAVRLQTFAPAYLFWGPRGTGKTSMARILASSINCEGGTTVTPCLSCPICLSIKAGSCPDVVEINGANNTGVDDMRELIEETQYAPSVCRRKIYVIDEVHGLSGAAATALLKTLEEPPEDVIFILATTERQKVLDTIYSRCMGFRFNRIRSSDIQSHLADIARKEGLEIDPDVLFMIAEKAQGGLRDAEESLDQVSLLSPPITLEKTNSLLGYLSQDRLLDLIEAGYSGDRLGVQEMLRDLHQFADAVAILQGISFLLKDILIIRTTNHRLDLTSLISSLHARAISLSEKIAIGNLLVVAQHLQVTEGLIKEKKQESLWLEHAVLNAFDCLETEAMPVPVVAPIIETTPIEVVVPKANPPIVREAPIPVQDEVLAFTPTFSTDLKGIWTKFLSYLQPLSLILLRDNGALELIDEDEITVRMKSLGLAKVARGQTPLLEAAFGKVLERNIRLVVKP